MTHVRRACIYFTRSCSCPVDACIVGESELERKMCRMSFCMYGKRKCARERIFIEPLRGCRYLSIVLDQYECPLKVGRETRFYRRLTASEEWNFYAFYLCRIALARRALLRIDSFAYPRNTLDTVPT